MMIYALITILVCIYVYIHITPLYMRVYTYMHVCMYNKTVTVIKAYVIS